MATLQSKQPDHINFENLSKGLEFVSCAPNVVKNTALLYKGCTAHALKSLISSESERQKCKE